MDAHILEQITAVSDPIERARAIGRVMADEQRTVTELARLRREAIAEAQSAGMRQDEIARRLGVSPGRVSQMKPARNANGTTPPVIVQRALPTDPAVRGSASLFVTEAERQGIRAERRMLHVGPEPAAPHIADALRVDQGTQVLARRKLLLANGVPVRVATSFFRLDLFAGTPIATAGDFVLPSLQSAIEALGYRFGHAEEHLIARPPSEAEADALRLDPGEWVVQVLRTGFATDDTPVHTLETICAASRHVFPIGQVAGADEF
ncbi:UTRA domain-containing protein [Thermopolyspora sp. NPDC052614]|uniref:GntR family transcriptional regulator n=1 Tax=Thermopolyspora sp. NPDC052614 TaxID=3155682 RepID=UPI00342B09FC